MASEVDICNLALGHIGDVANVSSINPPDGSAQAVHCARFYPIARDSLLELHPWGFATKRIALSLTNVSSNQWQYVYTGPSDAINYLRVMDPNATDDFSATFPLPNSIPGTASTGPSVYTPQEYVVETDDEGRDLVYTNQQDAVLLYSARVTDTTKFSPLFIDTLGRFLGSMLAGPIIKGDEGRKVSRALLQDAQVYLGRATTSDANQRRTTIAQSVSWMVNR